MPLDDKQSPSLLRTCRPEDPPQPEIPATPTRQPRIIAFDSSPLAASPSILPSSKPPRQKFDAASSPPSGSRLASTTAKDSMSGTSSSANRLHQSMSAGMERTSFKSPGTSLSNGHANGLLNGRSSLLTSMTATSNHAGASGKRREQALSSSPESRKKVKLANGSSFKSSLEQFRYNEPSKAPPRHAITVISDDSELSDADAPGSEEAEASAAPKPRRRLIRGGQTSSSSPSPPPVVFPSKVSEPGPNGSVPSLESTRKEKAKRLSKLFPDASEAKCYEALSQSSWVVGQALALLNRWKLDGRLTSARSSSISTPSTSRTPSLVNSSTSSTSASASAPSSKGDTRAISISDDDDGLGKGAADLSSDEDDEAVDRVDREDRAAVNWFNDADASALMDTTNCSAAQAEMIISMRPFKNAADVESRLGDKKAKGVTPRIFNQCKELMAGYYEVDAVLEKCEKIGRDLNRAMASWQPEDTSSRAASPMGKEESTLNLSSIKKGASVKSEGYLEEQPASLGKGVVLKDYQLVGVNWLNLLYRKKTSAILADEMGLGKTAQVIAFIASLKEKGIKGPHLVVVPSSVLENWDREFRFFAPDIYVRRYYGAQKERVLLREEIREDEEIEVILTTYDMAAGGPNDHNFLRKKGFNVCVFDEGHMLKNRKSQKYEKLLRIRSKWRLLLTGTPLQNNLQELVSLLNFIMPDYFNDAEEALSAIFKVKAGGQNNQLSQQRVDRAKKMMRPFVLRRLKDKVLTELTGKTIRLEYCEMTPPQKKLYAQAVARTKAALNGNQENGEKNVDQPRAGSRTRGGTTSSSGTNSNSQSGHVLIDLRKAANHPLLMRRIFDEAKIDAMARDLLKEPEYADYNFEHLKEDLAINTDAQLSLSAGSFPSTRKHVLPEKDWMDSGKVHALKRLIPEIQAKGDRLLIFSQFTMVLDILCVCLEKMGVKYVGFTGQTQVEDRQHLVDQFTNDPSITVFLLSTKAGGLGINLVAANWVIMFDQDFNPQNDKQAADRCYRMGQKKPVTVIKLISKGTIDENIHELGERKLLLADKVSGEDYVGENDEVEQTKTAQTLLAQLRDRAVDEVFTD